MTCNFFSSISNDRTRRHVEPAHESGSVYGYVSGVDDRQINDSQQKQQMSCFQNIRHTLARPLKRMLSVVFNRKIAHCTPHGDNT